MNFGWEYSKEYLDKLNNASFDNLRHSTSLNEKIVHDIIAKRELHGPFLSLADIVQQVGLKPQMLKKACEQLLENSDDLHLKFHISQSKILPRFAADEVCFKACLIGIISSVLI